jgi:hypothetical protein
MGPGRPRIAKDCERVGAGDAAGLAVACDRVDDAAVGAGAPLEQAVNKRSRSTQRLIESENGA